MVFYFYIFHGVGNVEMGMKNFLKFSIHRIFAHENGLFGRQTSGKKKLLSNILRKYVFVCSIIFDKNLTVYSKVLVVHTTQHLGAFSPWNNGKEVPRWGVAKIQKMSPSTTGRCK